MKRTRNNRDIAINTALLLCFMCTVARAADTTETFDRGATDAELYFGFDGVGLEKNKRLVSGQFVAGYGLIDGLSAYIAAGLEATDQFASGAGALNFGVFGTPLNLDHFDLDLFLDMGVRGEGFSKFQVTPSLELNLDHDPEHRTFGFYLRGGVPLYSRELATEAPAKKKVEATAHVETTLGAYVTVKDGHQLLLEYDMGFRPDPAEDERTAEIGGVALGYNAHLGDYIELVSQVFFDIPEQNETPAWGFSVGFIATMPSPAAPSPVAFVAHGERGEI